MAKFKEGDLLEFDGVGMYLARKGAKAICKGYKTIMDEEFIDVEWIKDELSNTQEDGGYFESSFKKVEGNVEVENKLDENDPFINLGEDFDDDPFTHPGLNDYGLEK